MTVIDRRTFVASAAITAASLLVRKAHYGVATPDLLIIGPDGSDAFTLDLRRGIELGVDEATRAARLFGGRVSATFLKLNPRGEIPASPLAVWIGGQSIEELDFFLDRSSGAGGLVFNAGITDEQYRWRCVERAFHVVPAKNDLDRAWFALKRPDLKGDVVAWHHSLNRFGADTLNKRFHERFKVPISQHAWLAWFAVKSAWEAALQSKATTSAQLLEALRRPAMRFDGHKGAPLYYESTRHQLVQPVYVISNDAVVSETSMPTRAVAVADAPLRCEWK